MKNIIETKAIFLKLAVDHRRHEPPSNWQKRSFRISRDEIATPTEIDGEGKNKALNK